MGEQAVTVGGLIVATAVRGTAHVDVPREHRVDAALDGMRRVVEQREGTGGAIRYESGYREQIFAIPGVVVWGKTGTAQSPPRRIDVDGDGAFGGPEDEVVRGLAHAWYAAPIGSRGNPAPIL